MNTPAMTRSNVSAAPAAPLPRLVSGLGALADRYDAFILDLWGCVHNGVAVYPGVLDLLRRLKDAHKHVLLLSNAPRRASAIVSQLDRHFGIPRGLYSEILTSGETAWQALKRRDDAEHATFGKRCLHVGPARDHTMFEAIDLERVGTVGEADFILVTGPTDDSLDVVAHEDVLREGSARGLPLVCANPDLVVMRGDEQLVCAGAIAARYEELGGKVLYHGKPHAVTYRMALDLLGRPAKDRVLCVGDGPRTDILGAQRAGLDSAFIPGGIHGPELGVRMGEAPDLRATADLLANHGTQATWILPELRW